VQLSFIKATSLSARGFSDAEMKKVFIGDGMPLEKGKLRDRFRNKKGGDNKAFGARARIIRCLQTKKGERGTKRTERCDRII